MITVYRVQTDLGSTTLNGGTAQALVDLGVLRLSRTVKVDGEATVYIYRKAD